jgi:hypothetical protein
MSGGWSTALTPQRASRGWRTRGSSPAQSGNGSRRACEQLWQCDVVHIGIEYDVTVDTHIRRRRSAPVQSCRRPCTDLGSRDIPGRSPRRPYGRVKCQFVDNLPTCVVEDEAGN